MAITRFNPTLNGNLHIGHVFTMLVNAYHGSTSFCVRFDDTSPPAIELGHDRRIQVMKHQRFDIEWFNIEVNSWQLQSELMPDVYKELKKFGCDNLHEKKYHHRLPTMIRQGMTFIAYPFVPQQTAERVVMDRMIGVTKLIRGEDFVTEYSLYKYFCNLFNYPHPDFVFLPRLSSSTGDISKTNGGYSIAELRGSGYSSDDLRRKIQEAALYYPDNGWEFYNMKPNPRFSL